MNVDSLTKLVLQWFACNGRIFPWRKTMDPYYIFIAEILLRRTQAKRVVETYLTLIKRYPTPEELSQANICELREMFKPLGLIRRADWLVDAAKRIVSEYGGLVPNNLDELSTLPGMGTYSSRAVVCLAFGKAVPMIDEGSGRLLRRMLNLANKGPAYSDPELLKIAEAIVPIKHARNFNLALLDIASAYCHLKSPRCTICPLTSLCKYAKK